MRRRKRAVRESDASSALLDRDEILLELREAISADEAEWAETTRARSGFEQGIEAGEPADAWEAYRQFSGQLRRLSDSNRRTWDALSMAMDPAGGPTRS